MWRFYDLQNGGRPPSWILKICSFCHVALVDMLFCFLIQNVAEIGHRKCNVPNFLCGHPDKGHMTKTEIGNRWLMSYGQKSDFQDGGHRHFEY